MFLVIVWGNDASSYPWLVQRCPRLLVCLQKRSYLVMTWGMMPYLFNFIRPDILLLRLIGDGLKFVFSWYNPVRLTGLKAPTNEQINFCVWISQVMLSKSESSSPGQSPLSSPGLSAAAPRIVCHLCSLRSRWVSECCGLGSVEECVQGVVTYIQCYSLIISTNHWALQIPFSDIKKLKIS